MALGVENIGKKDIAWSYVATVFMIGAGVFLLPFILHKMSAETVGIWQLFQTITMLIMLLDFGFRPTFARNISYIFAGVKELRKEGVAAVEDSHRQDTEPDYGLLKATISAMRRFYRWMALGVLLLLGTIGTAYMVYILGKYNGDRTDAIVAWLLLITINSYNLYTLYYDALLQGKGYIKRIQQITIVGQALYIALAIALIYVGLGLSAIVSAQLLSILVRRILMKRVFFDRQMKEYLASAKSTQDEKTVLSIIMPNAVKIGLTQLGGFLVNKSAIFLGSVFLPLEAIGCYGLTVQVMEILARCGMVYYQTYQPKLAQFRATQNWEGLRICFVRNSLFLLAVIMVGGIAWILWGNIALSWIHSDTKFVSAPLLATMLVINWLENNHATAAGFIMADNKIPFFIPSLLSGAATIVLLLIGLWGMDGGLWALILAPGIAQLAYQNWKWPSMVIKELWFEKH